MTNPFMNDKNRDIFFGFLFPEKNLEESIKENDPLMHTELLKCIDFIYEGLKTDNNICSMLGLYNSIYKIINNPGFLKELHYDLFPNIWSSKYFFKDLLFDSYFLNFKVKSLFATECKDRELIQFEGKNWDETDGIDYLFQVDKVFMDLGYSSYKEDIISNRKIPLQKHCIGLLRCILFYNEINKYVIKIPKQVGQYEYDNLEGIVSGIRDNMYGADDEIILTYIIVQRLFGLRTNRKMTEYILKHDKGIEENSLNRFICFTRDIPVTFNCVEILKDIVKKPISYLKRNGEVLNKHAYNLEESAKNISLCYRNNLFVFSEVAKKLFGDNCLRKIEDECLNILKEKFWNPKHQSRIINEMLDDYKKREVIYKPEYYLLLNIFDYKSKNSEKFLRADNDRVNENITNFKELSSEYLKNINIDNKDRELRRSSNADFIIGVDKLIKSLEDIKFDVFSLDIEKTRKKWEIEEPKENNTEFLLLYKKIAKKWFAFGND